MEVYKQEEEKQEEKKQEEEIIHTRKQSFSTTSLDTIITYLSKKEKKNNNDIENNNDIDNNDIDNIHIDNNDNRYNEGNVNNKGNTSSEKNMRQQLENIRKSHDYELNKISLELEYKRRLQQINDNVNVDKIYYKLESERKKNDLKKQINSLKINENIEIYPIEVYNKLCCDSLICFGKPNVIDDFDKIYKIITNLPSINNYEKNLILLRFSNIQTYCSKKYKKISKLYNISQIFLIACSIINPALLSINIDRNNFHYNIIFWIVWVLQLLVSLITGYISLYKWDKKNFLFNIYKTKINQEIWFFIGLTGKNYNNNSGNYSHSDFINLFLNRLEKIYTMLKTTEFEMENSKDYDNSANSNIRPAEIFQSRVSQRQPETNYIL